MFRSSRIQRIHDAGYRRRRQSGFTLIEVLVSALILSIGLVGVAGLQAVSLKNNQSSFMRSQATALAYDLADRMRANVPSAIANMYAPGTEALAIGCASTSGCSGQDMARHDLAEWSTAVANSLPMGQGFVCIDSTPFDGDGPGNAQCDGIGTQFAVKVWWDDDRSGAIDNTDANTERLSIIFQL